LGCDAAHAEKEVDGFTENAAFGMPFQELDALQVIGSPFISIFASFFHWL
jgi:hypothetical protein